jgi:hypothetical protein
MTLTASACKKIQRLRRAFSWDGSLRSQLRGSAKARSWSGFDFEEDFIHKPTRRTIRFSSIAAFCLFALASTRWNAGATARQEQQQPLANSSDTGAQKPLLTAEQIVTRLQERNRQREVALRKFHGTRVYRVHYDGVFGTREAEAVVNYSYTSPNQKEFVVVSQSGAKFIQNHVIKGLMDGEKEAATDEHRQRTALSAKNYNFTLAEPENAAEKFQYVLNVIPKHDDKYVYRGKIWVDSTDFSVTRIEAEPAKSPSFWVKKSEIRHRYEKIGDFWLPVENRTESVIRMGGHALLSIDYKDYELTETLPLDSNARVTGQ